MGVPAAGDMLKKPRMLMEVSRKMMVPCVRMVTLAGPSWAFFWQAQNDRTAARQIEPIKNILFMKPLECSLYPSYPKAPIPHDHLFSPWEEE